MNMFKSSQPESAKLHQKAKAHLQKSGKTAEKLEENLARMIMELREAQRLEGAAAEASTREQAIWDSVERLGGTGSVSRVRELLSQGYENVADTASDVLGGVKSFGERIVNGAKVTGDEAASAAKSVPKRAGQVADDLSDSVQNAWEKAKRTAYDTASDTKQAAARDWGRWQPYFDSEEWTNYFKSKGYDAEKAKEYLSQTKIEPEQWKEYLEDKWAGFADSTKQNAKHAYWNIPGTQWLSSWVPSSSYLPSLSSFSPFSSSSSSSSSSSYWGNPLSGGSAGSGKFQAAAPVSLAWGVVSLLYLWWLVKRVNTSRQRAQVYLGDGSLELMREIERERDIAYEGRNKETREGEVATTVAPPTLLNSKYFHLSQEVNALRTFLTFVPMSLIVLTLLEFNRFPALALNFTGIALATSIWMMINNGFLQKGAMGPGRFPGEYAIMLLTFFLGVGAGTHMVLRYGLLGTVRALTGF